MDNEQKAMQGPIEIPDELKQHDETHAERKAALKAQGGTTVWRGGRPGAKLLVQRPVHPTSRTMPQRVAFGRKPAGITDTRGVPSWVQQREPNGEQDIVHATKATPWAKKCRARARNKAARASRKANR